MLINRFLSVVVLGVLLGIAVAPAVFATEEATLSCSYSFYLPRGGETWRHGTNQTISWNKVGTCSTRVNLELFRNGYAAQTIASYVSNTGTYQWSVPPSVNPGRDYTIRIRDTDDDNSQQISSAFTITDNSGCSYAVTRPEEGETVYQLEPIYVEWERSGSCGTRVRLDLYRNNGYVLEIVDDTSNNGEWEGTVPGNFATGSGYSVRVTDLGNQNIYDHSGRFRVSASRPCIFDVTSPEDDDTWYTGETNSIVWTSSGACSDQVAIHLMQADEQVLTIESRTSNSGDRSWTVPEDLQSGHDYVIRVRDVDNADSAGFSDQFSILDASGPEYVYWLDNVARLSGSAGSVWRSDVVVLNPGETDAQVELWLFLPGGAQVLEATVRHGTEGIFEDVVGLIGVDGKGCLGIGSSQPLQVSGRVYSQATSGTFGQYVHGWTDGDGLSSGFWGRLLQLRQVEGQFRTNLTVTNSGVAAGRVRVTLYDSAGNDLHSYTIDLDPRELVQDLEPFKSRAGRANLGWGFAVVEAVEGSGLLVSASVVDSRTNDGTTIPIIVSTQ